MRISDVQILGIVPWLRFITGLQSFHTVVMNLKAGLCIVRGQCVHAKVFCITGGRAEWKGLKFNAFEMK